MNLQWFTATDFGKKYIFENTFTIPKRQIKKVQDLQPILDSKLVKADKYWTNYQNSLISFSR